MEPPLDSSNSYLVGMTLMVVYELVWIISFSADSRTTYQKLMFFTSDKKPAQACSLKGSEIQIFNRKTT